MNIKRLFFSIEILSPWPEEFPPGRVLLEKDRHLTIAFLGDCDLSQIQSHLSAFPNPPFSIGLAGYFDRLIFLPSRLPRVAAWHIKWLEKKELFLNFQKEVVLWLKEIGLPPKEKKGDFLSHVTIARSPFVIHEWKKTFKKLPLFARNIHLCQSLGHSRYEICWSHLILAPFEEIEHTADIAFLIRGENFSQLYLHAQLALSFYETSLIDYFEFETCSSLEEIVAGLNRMIARFDEEQGSPFKAISFHGLVKRNKVMEWEMIVDV